MYLVTYIGISFNLKNTFRSETDWFSTMCLEKESENVLIQLLLLIYLSLNPLNKKNSSTSNRLL